MSSTKSPSGSGAGARALKVGSGKKKKAASSSSATATAAAAAVPRVDHISPASAADLEAASKDANLTQLATQTAYPLMNTPYNPEDDVDEDVDEETLAAQMADLLKEEEATPCALTLEMIRQRTLPRDLLESGNQDLISKKLFSLERIYLDGLSLHSLDDSFDLFAQSLTHLYLQRNLLTTTQGFSCLKRLRFLMLSENRIRVVEDIAHLSELVFLDLSHNLIEVLDTGSEEEDTECQLPESLISLNFTGNPFTEDEDYVEHIVTVSPYLKTLDGRPITNAMRRDFGLEASDDDEDDVAAPTPSRPSTAAAAASAARRSAAILAGQEDEEDDDDDDDLQAATGALRAEAEEMRKRSQQRTMLYDTKHGVSQSTTDQDRAEALSSLQLEEAAAAAAAKLARR